MSQDQPFIWKSSLGGPISWVGQSSWGSPRQVKEFSQVDGVSDMALVCWPWGEGLEKGQWPLLPLMPDTSVSPYIPLVHFKLLPGAGDQEE